MRLQIILLRLTTLAAASLICVWLASIVTGWAAIGLWAVAVAVVCGGVAFMLHRQAPGHVTSVNHVAAWVLPWGYAIGRGKLLPIVIESWLRWLLLGIATILATAPRYHAIAAAGGNATLPSAECHQNVAMTILLAVSWIIDGAVVLRLLTVIVTRANANPLPPGTFIPVLGISALIAISVALTTFGNNALLAALALLLTGGPIVAIGGGYALMFLVMMTAGRRARWN